MSEGICRVVKRELLSGTYYIAQRWVWKSKWFGKSDYDWEDFCVMVDCYGANSFRALSDYEEPDKLFKDPSYAEAACSAWVRVNKGDDVVKVWSKEGLN